MKRWLIAAMLLPAVPALGDTVFLKNGAWIDGKVTMKTNTFVELQIGNIGKIQLPVDDIHSIEKNARTGRDSATPYVEPKGQSEVLSAKEKEKKAAEKKAEAKDAKAAPKAKEKPAAGEKKTPTETAKSAAGEKPAVEDEPAEGGEGRSETAKGSGKGEDDTAADKNIDPELKKRIQGLIAELSREKSRNRVQAERHLEAIGQPAIPFLLPVAKSGNELVRTAVMRLFHSFGDEQVIDAAIQGLLDENEYVRDYANKALKRITGEDFGYQAGAFPKRREFAYQKWVKWWENEKKTMDDERKLSEKSQ